MPVNDMGQPGTPGFSDRTPNPASDNPSNRQSAELAYTQAQAYQTAEQQLVRFIDTLKSQGRTLEEVAKFTEELAQAEMQHLGIKKMDADEVRKRGSAFNMTMSDIMKTPLNELTSNLEGLAYSLGRAAGPAASLATAIGLFQEMDKIMVGINRNVATFASASGTLLTEGFNPSIALRARTGGAEVAGMNMGFDSDQVSQFMGQLASTLPGHISKESGPEWAKAGMVLSKTMGISLEASASLIGESVRYGLQPDQIRASVDELGKIKDLSLQESTASFLELWKSTRLLGDSQKDAREMVADYATALRQQTATTAGLAQQRGGAFSGDFGELAKFATLAKQMGIEGMQRGTGGGVIGDVQGVRDMMSSNMLGFEDKFKQVIDGLAMQLGGVINQTTRLLAIRKIGGLSFMGEESQKRIFEWGEGAGGSGEGTTGRKITGAFGDLETKAQDMQKSTEWITTQFWRAAKSVGIFADIVEAANKKKHGWASKLSGNADMQNYAEALRTMMDNMVTKGEG